MRTEAENAKIDELAHALLKRRGIDDPTLANYEQVADAYLIAAEAVAAGHTTVPTMLANAAIGDAAPDEKTTRVLAKFANDGKFIADLSIDEAEFLEAAVAAEQSKDTYCEFCGANCTCG